MTLDSATLSPGLEGVPIAESAISLVEGQEGRLTYRGYSIDDVAEIPFEEVVALLYDDGELAERSRARDHLALCVPCRAEYAGLKNVRKELGGWTLPTSTTRTTAVADPPGAG